MGAVRGRDNVHSETVSYTHLDVYKRQVLSLIDGAFHDSVAADRISEKLTKSATKPDLVKIITHVASLYCWYISLKARIEQAEAEK